MKNFNILELNSQKPYRRDKLKGKIETKWDFSSKIGY